MPATAPSPPAPPPPRPLHPSCSSHHHHPPCDWSWCVCSTSTDGQFGAYMQVSIQNDGPVTIELTSPKGPSDPKQVQVYRGKKHTVNERNDTVTRLTDALGCPFIHRADGKRAAFIQRFFSNQWPFKALYNIASHIHPFMHTFTHRRRGRQPCKTSGALRVRCLAQGHVDIQLGGAGDRTSNLPVTSQPALPPEPHDDNFNTGFLVCF